MLFCSVISNFKYHKVAISVSPVLSKNTVRTSIALTPLEPQEIVQDKGSSFTEVYIIGPDLEALWG